MSRWSHGDWVLAAIAIDKNGNTVPFSRIERSTGFTINGYYSEGYLIRNEYYKMDDFTGEVYSRYEGHFTVNADLQIKDSCGGVNVLHKECDGYTCCGADCYMLLIIVLGDDAKSTTVEFQEVDLVEIEEAVGRNKLNNWMQKHHGKSAKVIINGPTFK